MLKEFQLIIEVVEDWLTVSKLPVVLGVAVPKDVEVYTGSIAANADEAKPKTLKAQAEKIIFFIPTSFGFNFAPT